MAIYENYASVYDRSGQYAFSVKMIPYIKRLLEKHPLVGSRCMLDLACGTGTVAIAMANEGWRVLGVDGSARMLEQASAKAKGRAPDIVWSEQDMRRLAIAERVSLVTCLYDSMNYMLTDRDLMAVLGRVYSALSPGGLFMFDMNTAYDFCSVWDDATYFSDSGDLGVVMQSVYDEQRQRTTVTVTCYERQGELYRKIVEQHTEQAYPPEQIATYLSDIGFAVEAMYRCFTFDAYDDETMRIMFVARKPA